MMDNGEPSKGKATLIGIGGVTCGGKTTIASRLKTHLNGLGGHQAGNCRGQAPLATTEDEAVERCHWYETDVYYWPEDSDYWKYDGTDNWEELASMDWDKLMSDVYSCLYKYKYIIIDGIMIFDHIELNKMFDKKFYFTLDEETVAERRKKRDYIVLEPPGYFEAIAWPFYLNQLSLMSRRSDITMIDADKSLDEIFQEILGHLQLQKVPPSTSQSNM